MSKTRRDFTAEFKREAVALLESGGKPLTHVAAELGIQPSMLRGWRTVIRGGVPRSAARSPAVVAAAAGGRIERLMRRHGIRALAGRRFRPCTTDSNHFLPVASNLLAQRFVSPAPGRIWLADITYIPTGDGWLYLAAILDLATRKIVGWSMRDHVRTELTLAALLMATQRQRPAPGLIHHSDRGSQGGFK